jgi:hypothetical protein
MMAFYPLGIPLLYWSLLFRNRKKLESERMRDADESLLKTAFLWDMYEPAYWWFEVFDAARRLCMTGLLVFVFKGSASQIVFAIFMSVCSVVAFLWLMPYAK